MKARLALVIASILIISDCITGVLWSFDFPFHRVGLLVKILVFFFALVYYLPLIEKKTYRSLYTAMLILFCIWLVNLVTSYIRNPEFDPLFSMVLLNRYFFFFVLAIIFIYSDRQESLRKGATQVLEYFFIINSFFIFVGFAFGLDWLSSYDPQGVWDYRQRFGYKGLIFGANEIAGIYMIGLAYLFREQFKYGENKTWLIIIVTISCFLTGAKAAIAGLILIEGYYLIKYRIGTFVLLIAPVIAGVIALFIVYWDFIYENYLTFTVESYKKVEFMKYLFSDRNVYLIRNFKFMDENWTIYNYIFGDSHLVSETDFFDLYFFFGIGILVFVYMYTRVFFIRDHSRDHKYFFAVLMVLSFTGGHIMESAVVPVFLLLFLFSARPAAVSQQSKTFELQPA